MTKISISEAIRVSGISRSHFYKTYINTGILSTEKDDNKKLIDMSELVRVFGTSLKYIHKEQDHTVVETIKTYPEKDKIIEILEQQVSDFKAREEWLQKQINELQNTQQYLLENKIKRKKLFWIF
jgi:predicted DNA-binding transcriptional regulator AlpA